MKEPETIIKYIFMKKLYNYMYTKLYGTWIWTLIFKDIRDIETCLCLRDCTDMFSYSINFPKNRVTIQIHKPFYFNHEWIRWLNECIILYILYTCRFCVSGLWMFDAEMNYNTMQLNYWRTSYTYISWRAQVTFYVRRRINPNS